MIKKVNIDPRADREYRKLDNKIRKQFDALLNKMIELENFPHKPLGNQNGIDLSGCYKLKLRGSGYRMVYEIIDNECVVLIISVGKRDKNEAYKKAASRLNN